MQKHALSLSKDIQTNFENVQETTFLALNLNSHPRLGFCFFAARDYSGGWKTLIALAVVTFTLSVI